MVFRRRRKYFRKRRFTRRRVYRRRFSMRKALSIRRPRPEIKWVTHDQSVDVTDLVNTNIFMVPTQIPLGTNRHEAIGAKIKTLRLSYVLEIVADSNANLPRHCIVRMAMISSLTNHSDLTTQVNEVMNNWTWWDPAHVHLIKEWNLILNNPYYDGVNSAKVYKGYLPWPRNFKLNNVGGIVSSLDMPKFVARVRTGSDLCSIRLRTKIIIC